MGLIYFITRGLYLLIPCTNFTPPHPSPPATTHLFFFIYIKILFKHYLSIFSCVLCVCCRIRAFSSSGEQGPLSARSAWRCAVHRRCGQMYDDMYPWLEFHTEYFHCLPKSSVLFCSSLPHPQLLSTTNIYIVPIVLPFPECHIVGIIQDVAFSRWLLSIRNLHLKFVHVFHGLIAHFFFTLINILSSGCITVYLSIQPLKDILVASKFWQL